MHVVYTTVLKGAERYWTGAFTQMGTPAITDSLDGAIQFDGARSAYEWAGLESRRCLALGNFRVGRRPTPVNLRSVGFTG